MVEMETSSAKTRARKTPRAAISLFWLGLTLYDAWNRLVAVYFDADADGNPDDIKAEYAYDGLKRQVRKRIYYYQADGTLAGNSAFHYYYNTSWQLLETTYSESGNPLQQYIWGLRYIDSPVCVINDQAADGDLTNHSRDGYFYVCNDANFNVTAMVDDSGTSVQRYSYDPYGRPEAMNGSWTQWGNAAYGNEFLYCGYRYDTTTGLYHVRHRAYHPTLGRWLQRDPAGYVDGMSLYEYCISATPSWSDPYGLAVNKLFHEVRRELMSYGNGEKNLPQAQALNLVAVSLSPKTGRGCKVESSSARLGGMGSGRRRFDEKEEASIYGGVQGSGGAGGDA